MPGHMIERSQPWVNGSTEPMAFIIQVKICLPSLCMHLYFLILVVKWAVEFVFWVGYMLSLIDWLIACANSSDDHGVHQWSPNGGPEGSNRLASHVWPGCGAPPLHWGRPPSQRLWQSNSESANGRKLFSGNHPYHLSSAFFFIKLSLLGTYICMLKYATIVLHCFLLFMIKAGVEADLKVLVWNKLIQISTQRSLDQMHGASGCSSSTIITGCSTPCMHIIDRPVKRSN
jgi:hypothetical protein